MVSRPQQEHWQSSVLWDYRFGCGLAGQLTNSITTTAAVHFNKCTPNHRASVESQRFFVFRFMPGSVYASPFLGFVLVIGRLVCASVEVWVLLAHITGLMQQDEAVQDLA